jgi:serine/threonine protein phosphatase PrpC
MGAFLDKPKTEKYNESKTGGGLKYGLSSMQGWRIEMEDAHSAIIGIPDQKETVSWFGVFDGHAGSRVSAHCAHHLLDCIRTNDDFTCSLQQEHTLSKDEMTEAVKRGMLKGFLELDEKLRKIPEVASGEDKSGTTAVTALITDKYLILANVGDSRGVFCVGGKPALATQDHKPSNELERDRIQNAGGTVMIQRVNGSLAVSRALGDFEYKNVEGRGPTEQLVSPEPEFFIKERLPEIDEFLVLACDGVWDVMTNEDICDFISARMKISDDLETICNEVIDTCLNKGSRDNMSIIIIAFPACPKVDPAAVKADQELNQLLEKNITDLVNLDSGSDIELSAVHQFLIEQDIQGFAAGGGFASKKVFVEEIYKKLLPEKYESSQEDCPNPLASLLFVNARNAAAEEN